MWIWVMSGFSWASDGEVAYALDPPGERIAYHDAAGRIRVYQGNYNRPAYEVDGPRDVHTLLLARDTLVAAGPGGVWVWTLHEGTLMHVAELGPVAMTDDGRYVATAHLLLQVGQTQPLAAWPEATAVAFSEDGKRVATLHGERSIVRAVPSGSAVSRASEPE